METLGSKHHPASLNCDPADWPTRASLPCLDGALTPCLNRASSPCQPPPRLDAPLTRSRIRLTARTRRPSRVRPAALRLVGRVDVLGAVDIAAGGGKVRRRRQGVHVVQYPASAGALLQEGDTSPKHFRTRFDAVAARGRFRLLSSSSLAIAIVVVIVPLLPSSFPIRPTSPD